MINGDCQCTHTITYVFGYDIVPRCPHDRSTVCTWYIVSAICNMKVFRVISYQQVCYWLRLRSLVVATTASVMAAGMPTCSPVKFCNVYYCLLLVLFTMELPRLLITAETPNMRCLNDKKSVTVVPSPYDVDKSFYLSDPVHRVVNGLVLVTSLGHTLLLGMPGLFCRFPDHLGGTQRDARK